MVAATIGWGLLGTWTRIALAEGLSPVGIAFWRCLLAGGAFALFSLGRHERLPLRDSLHVALFGVIGLATMYASFFIAVERVGPSLSVILLYTGPVWVALYQLIFRRQPPTRTQSIALTLAVLALIGVTGFSGTRLDMLGVFSGLLSGASFATHFVYAAKYMARYGGVAVFARALLVAALVMLPFFEMPSTATAWTVLIAAASVSTVLPSVFFAVAIKQLTPVPAATIATFEPVVGLAAAALFFDERLLFSQYIAAAVLIAALMISTRAR